MKKIALVLITGICLLSPSLYATHTHKTKPVARNASLAEDSVLNAIASYQFYADSVEKSVKYQHGTIPLDSGIGTIQIPEGFKYIDKQQAEHILYDLWHNRKADISTLGMILPEKSGVLSDSSFAFNIEYSDIGYVKDDDADKIDYNDLLKQMQEEDRQNNIDRVKEGYQPIYLIGWATKPYYDKERKILHWAKELKFGNDSIHTLNYNVRILGRKGVLVLNAIATMDQLKNVQTNLPKVMNIVSFSDGNQYKDFNPSIDKVAAWTIGGLVAGKILAKVGLWAVILKFGKVIVLAIVGAFAALRKRIAALFGRKKKDDDDMPPGVIRPSDKW